MAVKLTIPDLGDFEDVEVIEVLASPGDVVEVEDPLITLETDKAAMDVPATAAGRIEDVLIRVGDKVSAGASIAIIDAVAAEAPAAPAAEPAAAEPAAPPPPPAAESPPAVQQPTRPAAPPPPSPGARVATEPRSRSTRTAPTSCTA